jgi:thermostable 8-oxoguanine DNA glycosylase
MMEVRQISNGNWLVEVTDGDRKRIGCVVNKLKSKTEFPIYGQWRNASSEDIWEELLGQFCVIGSARFIERLQTDKAGYSEFLEKMSIKKLWKITLHRREYIARQLKEFKVTRFYNKNAERINNCLENREIVKDGKTVFLDDLKKQEMLDEEQMRDILLKRLPFFKMKSVSDFMITIGAAKGFIAFDTRVVGLLKKLFGLNMELDDIQYDKTLYEAIERKLRDVCEELGVELSLLDRILFRFSEKSAVEYILENECI